MNITREEKNKEKQEEIIKEYKDEKNKTVIKILVKSLIIIIAVLTTSYLYITNISTKKIEVNEKRIIKENIPTNFEGLKIIQFGDLHYGSTMNKEDVKKIVKEINKRKPDLVLFTGDLISTKINLNIEKQEELIKELKKIKSKLGKYAIYGDEDKEIFQTIMKQSNFTILDNTSELIYNNSNNPILLVGTNSSLNNKIDINKSYDYYKKENINKNILNITMTHEPDNTIELLKVQKPSIVLAGHSHTGDIRIPYYGPLNKYKGAKKYYNSYYKIDNTELFITTGLGTNKIDYRIFCRPSINFFRISSK